MLDGKNGLSTEVLSSVRQGTVLAPLLFLLYINDLPACVNNKVKLYLDDVLLLSFIESESDCIERLRKRNMTNCELRKLTSGWQNVVSKV